MSENTHSLTHRRQAAKQRLFLSIFQQNGNVRAAAKLAGVARQTAYDWKANSPAFAIAMAAAADKAFANPLHGKESKA